MVSCICEARSCNLAIVEKASVSLPFMTWCCSSTPRPTHCTYLFPRLSPRRYSARALSSPSFRSRLFCASMYILYVSGSRRSLVNCALVVCGMPDERSTTTSAVTRRSGCVTNNFANPSAAFTNLTLPPRREMAARATERVRLYGSMSSLQYCVALNIVSPHSAHSVVLYVMLTPAECPSASSCSTLTRRSSVWCVAKVSNRFIAVLKICLSVFIVNVSFPFSAYRTVTPGL